MDRNTIHQTSKMRKGWKWFVYLSVLMPLLSINRNISYFTSRRNSESESGSAIWQALRFPVQCDRLHLKMYRIYYVAISYIYHESCQFQYALAKQNIKKQLNRFCFPFIRMTTWQLSIIGGLEARCSKVNISVQFPKQTCSIVHSWWERWS